MQLKLSNLVENLSKIVLRKLKEVRFGFRPSGVSYTPLNEIKLQLDLVKSGYSCKASTELSEIQFLPEQSLISNKYITYNITNISGTTTFIFEQSVASDHWIINHNLNYFPNIRIEDEYEQDMDGIVQNVNQNRIDILFSTPVKGKAFLS